MNRITKKIIDTLRTFKEVEAIALGGAHARGIADKYSDVDIYVFYNRKLTDEKIRKRKLHGLTEFEKAFTASYVDFFTYKGEDIHTWWVDINKLKRDIKNDDSYTKVLITESKLLWDRKGKFQELRKSVKFPSWLTRKICTEERTLSSVPIIFRELVEKSLQRNRIYFAEWFIKTQTDNIIKAIYALNRRYYYNYPQYLQYDFKHFKYVPRNAFKNITKIGRYSLFENPKGKLTALYELYWGTVELIEKRYKFPHAKIFPEYADKKWYRKRIQEIFKMIRSSRGKWIVTD